MNLTEEATDNLILKSFNDFVLESKLVDKQDLDSTIDGTIGSYIVNTIKQFYEEYENHKIWLDNSKAEDFDVENFIEIIDAYLSGFNNLPKKSILNWLIRLKKDIDDSTNRNMQIQSIQIQTSTSSNLNDYKSNNQVDSKQPENPENIEDPNLKLLLEMFPEMCIKRINKIYKKSNKNYEKTIDELLFIQNAEIQDQEGIEDREQQQRLSEQERILLKEKTVQKFGLVEVNEDGTPKEVKPVFNWNSEKKMVRYFDSKVVTTKGDKYFELKTEEDEEKEKQLKKTYVNLKPARKYRFH